MEKILLNNGKYLVRDYGKYRSGLVWIFPIDPDVEDVFSYDIREKEKDLIDKILLQIPYDGRVVGVYRGEFRINKKGTRVFEFSKNGKDLLIKIDWGGSFDNTRGVEIDKVENYKYYRHASSNGGGTGYDWLVVPENFSNTLSEDDF